MNSTRIRSTHPVRFSGSREKTSVYAFKCPEIDFEIQFKQATVSINRRVYFANFDDQSYQIERACRNFEFISVSSEGHPIGEARIGIQSQGWILANETFSVFGSLPSCLSGRFLQFQLHLSGNPRIHAQWYRTGLFEIEGVARSAAHILAVAFIVFSNICEWDIGSG